MDVAAFWGAQSWAVALPAAAFPASASSSSSVAAPAARSTDVVVAALSVVAHEAVAVAAPRTHATVQRWVRPMRSKGTGGRAQRERRKGRGAKGEAQGERRTLEEGSPRSVCAHSVLNPCSIRAQSVVDSRSNPCSDPCFVSAASVLLPCCIRPPIRAPNRAPIRAQIRSPIRAPICASILADGAYGRRGSGRRRRSACARCRCDDAG